MKRPFAFLDDEMVASHSEDADGSSSVLDTSNANNLDIVVFAFFHEVSIAQLVLRESLDVCDRLATQRFGEEADFVTFNIFHNEDVETLQKVECDLIDCIAED